MRTVPFVKATACGNDFLLVESARVDGDKAEFTRKICDRHHGVGADGVEWLLPGTNADLQIHLINADGSAAEISGNGTRCVAAHWLAEQDADKKMDRVTIQTDAGIKLCKLTQRADPEFEFETEMGAATVRDQLTLNVAGASVQGIPVSTGNPHFVMFVEDFPPTWQEQAAAIGGHAHFQHGVNVELVKVVDEHDIEIRIFERGAGETQSSGTGSCASAVAAIARGRARSPLQVRAPGGTQTVRWENGEVYLRGPARLICRGEFWCESSGGRHEWK
jgi:diaminopimelate epimerase